MPRVRIPLYSLLAVAIAWGAAQGFARSAHAESAPPSRPWNVILILIDDLGATDLGCAGSRFYETPNIDRLANEGMRFTAGYSACTVCSPTRAALMTGKYPARLHITDWIKGHNRPKAKLRVPDWTMHLPLEETTIAERLRAAGYATIHIGKWHLGDPPYYPQHQGFDVNLGGTFMGQPGSYFFPYGTGERRVPLEGGEEGEYLTDRLAEEAVRLIEAHRDRPFFMYFAHYAVHTPLQAKPELIARYERKLEEAAARGDALEGQQCPVYAAMIHSMDEAVGRVSEALQRLGLEDRTVVVFTSDNGGLTSPACKGKPVTHNIGLRAGKGSAYEGGVRVPLIVKWPGVTQPGSTSSTPVISNDLYPTILEMTGTPDAPDHVCDGESLVPILKQRAAPRRSPLFWHYPHYHPGGATPYSAVRDGDWRLVQFFEDDHVELYNLRDDPKESRDLAARMPEKAKELKSKLEAWRAAVGAQLPTANPDYDPKGQP
ncbi:MAG: sulfatase [Thermogutta sp.]|nr:sulfatase [Thermogutta sp.]